MAALPQPGPLVFALLFVTVSLVGKLVVGGGDNGPARAVVPASARVPIVMVFFDEFPMTSLLDSKGQIDRRLYPNTPSWPTSPPGTGTPPGSALHPLRGAGHAHRPVPDPRRRRPLLYRVPGQPVHLAVGVLRRAGARDRDPALPAPHLRGRGGRRRPHRLAGPDPGPGRRLDQDRVATADGRGPDRPVRGGHRRPGGRRPEEAGRPTFRFNQLRANQPSRFSDFLDQLRPSDQPALHFLHILLPHQPWKYLPSGARYSYPSINFGYDRKVGWTTQPAPVQLGQQRHLLQVAYTDRLVGEVIQRLKDQGLYDKSLVVMTADHGISFTPDRPNGPSRSATPTSSCGCRCSSRPPPAVGQGRRPQLEHVDPIPTIADILKVKVPWHVDGLSGLGPERSRTEKRFYPARPASRGRRPATWPWPSAGSPTGSPGPEDGVAGLFEVGPYADLVGRRPERVGVAGAAGCGPSSTIPRTLEDVSPESGTIPALVSVP